MTVAISQSNYIPWKGYFDMIDQSDVFVLYDDMQYTRRDWRNRNKIKTASGLQWLTVPVYAKGKYHQKINETAISEPSWSAKHLRAIELAYGRAEYFETMFPLIKNWYEEAGEMELLSDANRFLARTNPPNLNGLAPKPKTNSLKTYAYWYIPFGKGEEDFG